MSELDTDALATRLGEVRARIDRAARAAGRQPGEVQLLGVTKTHPPEVARAAVALGLVDLAENRVQELTAKAGEVPGARWHLVGQLQRNKVRDLVGRAILVHSVDRRSLVDELSRRADRAGIVQRILIQVNVGEDPAKSGCRLPETADLVAYARARDSLAVEGLMTIPPLPPPGQDATTAARPHFAALRAVRDELRADMPELEHLSMGMSADLEAAVAEGATMVRIGTALFGPRGTGPWRKDAA
ncbi:MAG: YggS family pyridoxal phosphate-dependent enzyme [Nitriliruptoraceae bacterium]